MDFSILYQEIFISKKISLKHVKYIILDYHDENIKKKIEEKYPNYESVIPAAAIEIVEQVLAVMCSAWLIVILAWDLESSGGRNPDLTAFIRRADLARERGDQRPDRFAIGQKVDARVTQFDRKTRKVGVSIKALEVAEEKEALAQYGSADSGASLGDILGAALKQRAGDKVEEKPETENASE